MRIGFDALIRASSDMGVKVTFLRDEAEDAATEVRPVSLVPRAAIRADGAIARDGRPRRHGRAARHPGRRHRRDRVEVTAGLAAGERVVSPPADLRDGQPIMVRQGQ